MIKQIANMDINYIDYGEGEKTLVFLHGWGQNIAMMKMIADPFQKECRIIILDLPGFGESSEPDTIWSLYDYVEMLHTFLQELKVENPILLGHSFGGKISLLYATQYRVQKLVAFGSPYKREIQKLSVKTKVLKGLKKVPVINKLEGFAKKHIGSTDYKSASTIMREILVNHVNLDISNQLGKIKAPTLLVWGALDEAVPVEQAYELEKLIPDAGVVEFPNCTHYAYLENLAGTVHVLRNFL
ncbi:MAG: alpha/beta hydrolase [Bacilli bacterium]|nr:alpha/beta hydrolase [Bacilli bacterium]